jgi:uncharacterized small protein (DUF1192 family)
MAHLQSEIEIGRVDARRATERIAELAAEIERLGREMNDTTAARRASPKPGV